MNLPTDIYVYMYVTIIIEREAFSLRVEGEMETVGRMVSEKV